jgi:hypothetical protein
MSYLSKRNFYRRFPGPFSYREGRDGVDDTFDVFCLTTNAYLLSSYYWAERGRAELEVRIACLALNAPLLGKISSDAVDDVITFYQQYRAAYASRRTFCDYRGPGYEVYSQWNDECVIDLPRRTRLNRLVARRLASALNALFASLPAIAGSGVDDETYPACPTCESDLIPLGQLGYAIHYRCRNCGINTHTAIA